MPSYNESGDETTYNFPIHLHNLAWPINKMKGHGVPLNNVVCNED